MENSSLGTKGITYRVETAVYTEEEMMLTMILAVRGNLPKNLRARIAG